MNKRALIAAAIAAVIILGLAVWSMNYSAQQRETNTPSTTQAPEAQAPRQNDTSPSDTQESQVITYENSGFSQPTYTFAAGETITVVNRSSRTLEFASDEHPSHRDNPELNLAPIRPGAQATFAVSKAGTWGIHDHLREEHTTTVVVTE